MGNPIFNFFFVDQKALWFFFTKEKWTFSFQNCFQNLLWTSGSGQTENMQIRICVFSVWPHSKVQKLILKAVLKWEGQYFYWKQKFLSVLINNKKVENWISHCVFKSCAEGFRVFFHAKTLIFAPNALYLPTKKTWGAPNFWFWLQSFIRIG